MATFILATSVALLLTATLGAALMTWRGKSGFGWSSVTTALTRNEEVPAATVEDLKVTIDRLNRSQFLARTGNWEFDPNTEEVWWSDEVYRLVGSDISQGPLNFDEILELCVPEQRDAMRAATRGAIETGEPYSFDHVLVRPDGTRITVHEQGEVAFNIDGKPTRIYGTVQDISKRAKAEHSLRISEERFQTLWKLSPVGVFYCDRDGRCLYVNEKWCELSGRSKTEAIGDGWQTSVYQEDWPEFQRIWSKSISNAQPFSLDFRFSRPDGSTRWVVGQLAPHFGEDGAVEGFVGSVTDITEQKRTLAALQTSEARLATSHKIASLGFYEWNMIDNSATWSPEIDEVFGFSFNEIANTREKYRDLIHPDDVQSWLRTTEQRKNTAEPLSGEYRLILPDGSVRNVLGVGQVVRDINGTPVRVNGTLQDITALRNAEASLRQVTAEQKVILENAEIGICFVKDHRIIRSNQRLAKMLGQVAPEKLKTIDVEEFFSTKSEAKKFIADADRAFRNGRPHESERRINLGDNTDVWIRTIGSAADPSDLSKGSIWLVEDITRRKGAEEALRHSQKMDAVGQLTGGIAHDFNNLLGVIIGNLEIMEQLPHLRKSDKAWVERAIQAALRGADLTARLLKFSRGADSEKQTVVLNDAITDMEDMLRRSLTSEIQIQTELTSDPWLTKLELADLENAVVNLAINARDAMPGGGVLKIETANISHDADGLELDIPLGDYVLLAVSDTGTGMPPEVLERVFDPFYSTKKQGKGTGLGLSMVYGFVERSSGHIRVSSRLGAGTTFRMYFPRFQGLSAIEADPASRRSIELPQGDEVVLLVDDEIDLRDPTAAQLTKLGYHVLTAENGPAALKVLNSGRKIDLLLSDVVMPGGMSGYDLAKQAQKQFSGLRIVLTSGNAGRRRRASDSPQDGDNFPFLPKPYQLEELALKVREVLGQPKD